MYNIYIYNNNNIVYRPLLYMTSAAGRGCYTGHNIPGRRAGGSRFKTLRNVRGVGTYIYIYFIILCI